VGGIISGPGDVFRDLVSNGFRREALAEVIHKIALVVHEVKHDGVVYQVVVRLIAQSSFGEVNPE
jgi:hypothetical protein